MRVSGIGAIILALATSAGAQEAKAPARRRPGSCTGIAGRSADLGEQNRGVGR